MRVEDPKPEPDPTRTGCLWVGGILGVIAGIVVTLLAVPSILNFLFPSETIGVGESFENDKLELRVREVVFEELEAEPQSNAAYVVRLDIDANSSWSPPYHNFVLVLEDGSEIRAESHGRTPPIEHAPEKAEVPQGESVLELQFSNGDPSLPPPDSLHLEEPPVKFELPAPVTP